MRRINCWFSYSRACTKRTNQQTATSSYVGYEVWAKHVADIFTDRQLLYYYACKVSERGDWPD